jgi:hypothetical protein
VLSHPVSLPYSGGHWLLSGTRAGTKRCFLCLPDSGPRMISLNNRRDSDGMVGDNDDGMRASCLTSAALTSIRNMGDTPRLSSQCRGDGGTALPQTRARRDYMPSQERMKQLLSRAVIPLERAEFCARFEREMFHFGTDAVVREDTEPEICNTPVRWVREAFDMQEDPLRLRYMEDMFPEHGTPSECLQEFYILIVILNRAVLPARCKEGKADENQDDDDDEHVLSKPRENGKPKVDDDCDMLGSKDCTGNDHTCVVDPDEVRMVGCYEKEELGDELDFKFRTMILFLPQSGVFYCARERRRADVGVAGTLFPHDMAWLRMHREEIPGFLG